MFHSISVKNKIQNPQKAAILSKATTELYKGTEALREDVIRIKNGGLKLQAIDYDEPSPEEKLWDDKYHWV